MIGSKAEIQCGSISGVNYTWRGPANLTLPTSLTTPSVSVSDDRMCYCFRLLLNIAASKPFQLSHCNRYSFI